jgi:hypothetical protein
VKGVQEFLQWFETQSQTVQTVTVLVAFALLLLVARTASRWAGGKK